MSDIVREEAPLRKVRRMSLVAAGFCLGLFAFAFIAAPHACDWGLTAYFWAGVALLVALSVAIPAVSTQGSTLQRIMIGAGVGALVLLVWVAGLFAANVQILCRLF